LGVAHVGNATVAQELLGREITGQQPLGKLF
jgi:hypothetical protein